MTTDTNGTRRKMFPLEMNGVEIRTLEDRFYDDEADAVAEIHIDDRNATLKICAALNVDCDTDWEFTQRLREKNPRTKSSRPRREKYFLRERSVAVAENFGRRNPLMSKTF